MTNHSNNQLSAEAKLGQAVGTALYRHITPHMQRYQAAAEPEQYLPLADPRHFEQFALQATRDVAALLVTHLTAEYQRLLGTFPAARARLEPLDPARPGFLDQLQEAAFAPCWRVFGQTLERYADVYAGFCQVVGHVNSGNAHLHAMQDGFDAAELGHQLLGPFGAAAFGFVGGFFSGNRVQKHCEAELARYNQAFSAMTEAWDQACDALHDTAGTVLFAYSDAMIEAAARESEGCVPLALPACKH
jgi:hypothetical protein